MYLEGEAPIRVTENELLHFGLYAGLDIDPASVVELKKRAAQSETRLRAVNMISARPLSRQELQRRLCDKGATEQDAAAAADWLESIGALDDLAYARTLVRHYSENGYGAAKLRDELYRRGIARELWDEALAAAPEAQETAARVLAAKLRGRTPDARERKRLSDLLLRRGFSWGEVRAALNAVCTDYEED